MNNSTADDTRSEAVAASTNSDLSHDPAGLRTQTVALGPSSDFGKSALPDLIGRRVVHTLHSGSRLVGILAQSDETNVALVEFADGTHARLSTSATVEVVLDDAPADGFRVGDAVMVVSATPSTKPANSAYGYVSPTIGRGSIGEVVGSLGDTFAVDFPDGIQHVHPDHLGMVSP